MDGFHFSRVLPWHLLSFSDLDFGLVFGFGFYGFSEYDFVGFSLDQDAWFFNGSGSVGFCRIGIRLVFQDLDIRFFC